MKIPISVSSKCLKHHKYWNIAKTHLGYLIVAQNQSDHVIGQHVHG